jgi:hypothetical protein
LLSVFFLFLLISFKIYNSTNELPDSWDALPIQDVFLKTAFLNSLEQSAPSNISSYYLCIYKQEELVGIAIIQRVQMYVDDVFRKKSNHTIKQFAKNLITEIIKGNALIVGNLMHTGQHGIFFLKDKITQDVFLEMVYKAIETLSENIKKQFNKKIRIIAFKDYFEDENIHNSVNFFKQKKLYKAQVQPNMMFSIPTHWKTPEDYVSALTKKYRSRYRTARKKSTEIQYRELELDAIKTHSNTLYKLYLNVSDNARVNSFILNKNHFLSLKAHLQEEFKVFGYFLNNELIGFYTLILSNDALETYFLGYNQELQHKHQMYLNMLYDMACFAIENNFKTIVYARTAMEIKSSVGAKPYNMYIYLKHTNNFMANSILKLIVTYMNPIRVWQERHPFK